MNETRYLISETAKITQVEPHVLRYWEEELGLAIGRNEMGHRYYTEKDICIFQNIKELKKKGLQLRAIRAMIKEENPDIHLKEAGCSENQATGKSIIKIQEKRPDKYQQKPQEETPETQKKESPEKTKEQRFGEIMERLIHDIELGERKEGRYRRLDEAIRKHQQSRKMVAATEENVKRNKKQKSKKNKKI